MVTVYFECIPTLMLLKSEGRERKSSDAVDRWQEGTFFFSGVRGVKREINCNRF